MTSLLLTLTFAAPLPAREAPPEKRVELFGQQPWYKTQAGKEQEFVGTLEKVKGGGGIGFGRMNPYRVLMQQGDRKTVREVYIGGKPQLLAPYVGQRIKLVGKPVDLEVEGKNHREIWPSHAFVAGRIQPKDPMAPGQKPTIPRKDD